MASAVVGTLRILLEANAQALDKGFDSATLTVQKFDKVVASSGKSLNRMVEQFSGQRIVAEADRMAMAVQKVGGVSNLTDRELKKVAFTVNEATAKLRAMGMEVPPSIAKLSAEMGSLGNASVTAGTKVGGLSSIMGKLGPMLPIASVAGLATGIIRLGTNALETAGRLSDLSAKTGLGTQTLQKMEAVAKQTGTSVEAFAKSATTLGVNLANGTDKAQAAVQALGLSFTQLANLKPEEQFHKIIAALEQEENVGKRNAAGRALFGKQWDEIAAGVVQGYTKIADAANTMSDAQVAALDRAGDRWQKFKDDLGTALNAAGGEMVMFVEGMNSAFSRLKIGDWAKIIGTGLAAGVSPEKIFQSIAKGMNEVGQAAEKAKPPTEAVAKAVENYSAKLKEAQDAVKGLSAAQKSELNAAFKTGGDDAKNYAESIGLSDTALRLYQNSLKGTTSETTKAESATKKFRDSVSSVAMLSWAPFAKTVDDTSKSIAAAVVAVSNLKAGLEANGNLMSGTIQDMGKAQAAAAKWAHEMGAVLAPAMHGFSGSLNVANVAIEKTATKMQTAFAGVAQSIVSAIQGGGNIVAAAGGTLGVNLGEMFVKNFGSKVTGLLGSTLGGALNSLIPGLGALLGPLLGSLASKIGGFLKGLFGVSPEIKAARTELEGFQAQLRKGLTDQQKVEAGNEQWKMDIIAIRDAFLKVGRSEEEALKMAEALWDTDNPERSKKAMEEIQKVMDQIARETDEATDAANDLGDALDDATVDRRVNVTIDYEPGELPQTPDPNQPRAPEDDVPGFDQPGLSAGLNLAPVSPASMSGLAASPRAASVPVRTTTQAGTVVHNNLYPLLVTDRTEIDTLVRATERHMAERGVKGNEFGLREMIEDIMEQVVDRKIGMGLSRG